MDGRPPVFHIHNEPACRKLPMLPSKTPRNNGKQPVVVTAGIQKGQGRARTHRASPSTSRRSGARMTTVGAIEAAELNRLQMQVQELTEASQERAPRGRSSRVVEDDATDEEDDDFEDGGDEEEPEEEFNHDGGNVLYERLDDDEDEDGQSMG